MIFVKKRLFQIFPVSISHFCLSSHVTGTGIGAVYFTYQTCLDKKEIVLKMYPNGN